MVTFYCWWWKSFLFHYLKFLCVLLLLLLLLILTAYHQSVPVFSLPLASSICFISSLLWPAFYSCCCVVIRSCVAMWPQIHFPSFLFFISLLNLNLQNLWKWWRQSEDLRPVTMCASERNTDAHQCEAAGILDTFIPKLRQLMTKKFTFSFLVYRVKNLILFDGALSISSVPLEPEQAEQISQIPTTALIYIYIDAMEEYYLPVMPTKPCTFSFLSFSICTSGISFQSFLLTISPGFLPYLMWFIVIPAIFYRVVLTPFLTRYHQLIPTYFLYVTRSYWTHS